MTVLQTFENVPEADIIKGMLAANGVESQINGNDNPYDPYFGAIELMVDDKDLPRARKLLKQHGDL